MARLLLLARKTLLRPEGVVALETLFSMMILFSITLLFAGVAGALHNQAVLNGATQLAAQESLMAYDRTAYRQALNGDSAATAGRTFALQVAQDVYNESTRSMATTSQAVHSDPIVWVIECASNYDGQAGANGFSWNNCGGARDSGRVERVFAAGHANAGFWLGDYINGDSGHYQQISSGPGALSTAPGAGSQQPGSHSGTGIFSVGAAYSSGPCSRTGSLILGLAQC